MKSLPLALLPLLLSTVQAAERPAVTQPRQTSGDKAVQPAWEQTLTITGSKLEGLQGPVSSPAKK